MNPEDDEGPVEYKLKLIDKNTERKAELSTQMRFRMDEGKGECIYYLGVTDNGYLEGMTTAEYEESWENLNEVADKNNYILTLLSSKKIDKHEGRKVYEILVRENNEYNYIDIKVAIAGNVDSGKSSLLGVLTTGKLDNGRGSSRISVFNFKHEVTTGRTSSVGHQILGFSATGKPINYNSMGKSTWPEIVKNSKKIVTFFDLAGHEKYLRTTILGLASSFPEICLILVGANMGVNKMTREHIFLCLTLKIPFAICISKIDICQDRKNILDETVQQVNKVLKLPGVRRIPYKVNNNDDVLLVSKNIYSNSIVPIFHISNVTGMGIEYLLSFFNLLRKREENVANNIDQVEMHIDQIFSVKGVGTIVGGNLLSGTINIGDKLLLGPNRWDKFDTIKVKSIHCKKVPLLKVRHGSYVCIALQNIKREFVRKGNILVSVNSNPNPCREFTAKIYVSKSHATTIKPGYEPVLHTCSIRQTAKILEIKNKRNARKVKLDDNVLRTGDRGNVKFRFIHRAEYIKPGYMIMLAEGRVKIIGMITEVY